jgi:hypothetical protein
MAARELTSMSVLDESSLTANMRAMLDSGVVYARSGQLLISLNPYKRLPLYDEETLLSYRTSSNPASMTPHIYGVAAEAHARLIERGRSQTIIISGESGAGKTENAKYVMQYLASTVIPREAAQAAEASEGGALGLLSSLFGSKGASSAAGASLHEKLLRSNPLLEAFGCARTGALDAPRCPPAAPRCSPLLRAEDRLRAALLWGCASARPSTLRSARLPRSPCLLCARRPACALPLSRADNLPPHAHRRARALRLHRPPASAALFLPYTRRAQRQLVALRQVRRAPV